MQSNSDTASIRSISSSTSKGRFSWIRRRTPQQDADIARPINTDVANMFAIRHTGNNTLSTSSLSPVNSSPLPSPMLDQTSTTFAETVSHSQLSEDANESFPSKLEIRCPHNFQHEQHYDSRLTQRNSMKSILNRNAEQQHGIRVVVQSASDLPPSSRNGTRDPYTIIRYGSQTQQTGQIPKTLNPTWQEELYFLAEPDKRQTMSVEVCSPNSLRGSETLGSGLIDISFIPFDSPKELTLELIDESSKSKRRASKGTRSMIKLVVTRTNHVDNTVPGSEDEGPCIGLRIIMKEGRNLMIADRSGSSDPYAVLSLGKNSYKTNYLSKTINPDWNEECLLRLDPGSNIRELRIDVFDHDRFGNDYMGSAVVPIFDFNVDEPVTKTLSLYDDGRKTSKPLPQELGTITLTITRVLEPIQKNLRKTKTTDLGLESSRVIEVKVIAGKDLIPMDPNGEADPFVKVTIGDQSKKTKVVYKNRNNPCWNQGFRFEVHSKASLINFSVYDKDFRRDEFMGVLVSDATIDLSKVPLDEAQMRWIQLSNNGEDAGELQVVVSVSQPFSKALISSSGDDSTGNLGLFCGKLTVHLKSAVGLAAMDAGRTSDPFVLFELGNKRKRTKTIPKTCNPDWNDDLELFFILTLCREYFGATIIDYGWLFFAIGSFLDASNVADIFDVLHVTVYDEDRGGKTDFLGAIVIPLLEMPLNQRVRYPLKSKHLDKRFQGEIILSFELKYNKLPAYLQLIKRRETRFFEESAKLRVALLRQNIQRVRSLIAGISGCIRTIEQLFNWEFGFIFTLFAMVMWVLGTVYLYFYHVPLLFALALLYRRYFSSSSKSLLESMIYANDPDDEEDDVDDDDDDDDIKQSKKAKPSRRTAWYTTLKNIALEIQIRLGEAASFGERVKNFFNWSVPTITGIVASVMALASVVLFIIPFRYILLLWGRIPNDIELVQRKRLPPLGKKVSSRFMVDEDMDVDRNNSLTNEDE
eukprot:gene11349-3382_t